MFLITNFLQTQVVDGPDDEGNMYERPGKVSSVLIVGSLISDENAISCKMFFNVY